MFRKFSVFLVSLCAVCTVAETPDAVITSIMAQERAWANALLEADMDAVDALMHANFRLVRSYGDEPPIDKATYLATPGMSAHAIDITSAEIDRNDRVAVARLAMTLDWEQEGVGKLPPHFNLTDVWIQGDDGTWRILSRVSQLSNGPVSSDK